MWAEAGSEAARLPSAAIHISDELSANQRRAAGRDLRGPACADLGEPDPGTRVSWARVLWAHRRLLARLRRRPRRSHRRRALPALLDARDDRRAVAGRQRGRRRRGRASARARTDCRRWAQLRADPPACRPRTSSAIAQLDNFAVRFRIGIRWWLGAAFALIAALTAAAVALVF